MPEPQPPQDRPTETGPRIYLAERLGAYVVELDGRYYAVADRQQGWAKREPYAGPVAELAPVHGRAASTIAARLGVTGAGPPGGAAGLLAGRPGAPSTRPASGDPVPLRLLEPPDDEDLSTYQAAEHALAEAMRAVDAARRTLAAALARLAGRDRSA